MIGESCTSCYGHIAGRANQLIRRDPALAATVAEIQRSGRNGHLEAA